MSEDQTRNDLERELVVFREMEATLRRHTQGLATSVDQLKTSSRSLTRAVKMFPRATSRLSWSRRRTRWSREFEVLSRESFGSWIKVIWRGLLFFFGRRT